MEPELKPILEELGAQFEKFKGRYDGRLDELEKKLNRPQLAGDWNTIAAKETPEQRKALESGIRSLLAGSQSQADKFFVELKGMQVGIDPEGGYLVTPTFSTDMTRIELETAPFIGMARTIELTQGDVFEEPVDKDSAGADWVGETQARPDTSAPQIAYFTCPVHEICAQPLITQKLIDTARIDVVSWLQDKVASKFGNTESAAFFSGNGVKKPHGFLSLPTAATGDATRAWGTLEHVVTGANGDFTTSQGDVLIDLVSRLKTQYRKGAAWLMNRKTIAKIWKFKTSTTAEYIWQPGLQQSQPPMLLGYPVQEAEEMPDTATGSLSIAFGNFLKGYTIVRRLGVRFLLDPYTSKPNVKLYTYTRVGGGVNNSEAIKLLKFST